MVTARLRSKARITITNHPIGGPVFAGPQVQPWFCTTTENGLGPATDAQCNAPTMVTYQYRSAVTRQFAAYDPANPPLDVATTTTDQGVTVPYIVRHRARNDGSRDLRHRRPRRPESAVGARGVAAVVEPQARAAVRAEHRAAPQAVHTDDSVLDDNALSRGFMVADNSLNIQGKNANNVVNAEAVMMLKEHILEAYGSIRYTIGQGCSGGSIGQHVVASTYPGLLDGI